MTRYFQKIWQFFAVNNFLLWCQLFTQLCQLSLLQIKDKTKNVWPVNFNQTKISPQFIFTYSCTAKWDHSFRRYATFSKKLTLLSPRYQNVRVHIGGYTLLVCISRQLLSKSSPSWMLQQPQIRLCIRQICFLNDSKGF